jgi:hypothetical protein
MDTKVSTSLENVHTWLPSTEGVGDELRKNGSRCVHRLVESGVICAGHRAIWSRVGSRMAMVVRASLGVCCFCGCGYLAKSVDMVMMGLAADGMP